MYEYSEKEIALILYYLPWLEQNTYYKNIPPSKIYDVMVQECFLFHFNRKNVYNESLWRCFYALKNNRCYRMTPEWDKLISDKVLGISCFCELSGNVEFVTIDTCCELCEKFLNDKKEIL